MKLLTSLTLLATGLATAHGAIVYSGLQNIAIPIDFAGIYLSIDTGVTASSAFAGWDINPFFGGAGVANSPLFQPARIGPANDDPILALNPGTLVDNSLFFSTGFGGSGDPVSHLGSGSGQFAIGEEEFFGFRFNEDGGAGPYFGWMRVMFTDATPGGKILDWAYDNAGSPIFVAAVPEPTLGLFVALNVLAVACRRFRTVSQASASRA